MADSTGRRLPVTRGYRDNTFVLVTDFGTDAGSVRLSDAMLPHETGSADCPAVVRVVEGLSGTVRMRLRWVFRPAYGQALPWVRRRQDAGQECILAVSGPVGVTLSGDPLPAADSEWQLHECEFTVHEAARFAWVMAYHPEPDTPPMNVDAAAELDRAERFWRTGRAASVSTGPMQRRCTVR